MFLADSFQLLEFVGGETLEIDDVQVRVLDGANGQVVVVFCPFEEILFRQEALEPGVGAEVDGGIVGFQRQASLSPVSVELNVQFVDLGHAQ